MTKINMSNDKFKQFWLGGSEQEKGFTTPDGEQRLDRLAVLALLNSFVVSPNVLQTSKSLIVGSGSGKVTLDPTGRGIETGRVSFSDTPLSPNTGLRDGLIEFHDTLFVSSDANNTTTYHMLISGGTQIDMIAPDAFYMNSDVNEFIMTGGLSSTTVQITRRNNSPVVKFPNFESPPATCSVGDLTVAGAKLYICTATNTWTVVGTQT